MNVRIKFIQASTDFVGCGRSSRGGRGKLSKPLEFTVAFGWYFLKAVRAGRSILSKLCDPKESAREWISRIEQENGERVQRRKRRNVGRWVCTGWSWSSWAQLRKRRLFTQTTPRQMQHTLAHKHTHTYARAYLSRWHYAWRHARKRKV